MKRLKFKFYEAKAKRTARKFQARPFYIYFGGQKPFKVGEILSSKGNSYKQLSYGNAKIIGEFKQTRFRTFVDKRPKIKVFLEGLGFKFRVYDYKCIAI